MSKTRIISENITDGNLTSTEFSGGLGDANVINKNTFNLGLIGFKMAVTEGLTVFNLKDGVVDEFNDETGIDTAENAFSLYDSAGDFYGNQGSSTGPVVALLNTSSVTYESPGMAEISGITSQTNPADGVGTFGQIAIPEGTTSIDVLVMTGGGGQGAEFGGPGGNVQATINYPQMAGATWDYVVGEGGGGESSDPDHIGTHFGGFGGGGGGFYGSGGGFSGIFAGEAALQEGGSYGSPAPYLSGSEPALFPDEGPVFSDTVAPSSAPITVLAVGGGGAGGQPNSAGGGRGGGGGFDAGQPGEPGGSRPAGGGANQENNGSTGAPAPVTHPNWNVESPDPTAIHFRGMGYYSPYPAPINYGSVFAGGSGYHGGGGGHDYQGNTSGNGGGAGFANPTYVPAPTIEYASAAPATGLTNPLPGQSFFTGLPAPQKGLVPATMGNATGESVTTPGVDGGILISYTATVNPFNATSTLISDTFTATTTPSTARIVVFAEITDDLNSDVVASATRDNTTFNNITLTDNGFLTGSSGAKIYTGSTPLTGTASPQVRMRWKLTGTNQTTINKIHGVALQWA